MDNLKRLDKYRYEIPMTGGMKVPGIIYTSAKMLGQTLQDNAPQQVMNVAHLPGIVGASLAMPDIHWGYGFPIGGVAAFDVNKGVISPGGVGYDINCGVRLATLDMGEEDIRPHLEKLVDRLFSGVPCGVGRGGDLRLSPKELRKVLREGARRAIKLGFGETEDLAHIENGGCLEGANPEVVSRRAYERGKDQVGTLGSGNHFLEIGVVDEIFDVDTANTFSLAPGQVTVMIHSGSRGLGYQVCDESIPKMLEYGRNHGTKLPDRQLACAPFQSKVGQNYFSAMAAAANYAWANRQVLMHITREIIARTLEVGEQRLGWRLLYDVCHNIAKVETHTVNGQKKKLVVHRKGATRSFGPGLSELPKEFQQTGQPVLIPGDMGRASYVLAGTTKAMEETFGSTCHGAGRVMSRHGAIKKSRGRHIAQELLHKGIFVRGRGRTTLAEEMPDAYKDVSEVVDVVHGAGIARKVARLVPLGVVKG